MNLNSPSRQSSSTPNTLKTALPLFSLIFFFLFIGVGRADNCDEGVLNLTAGSNFTFNMSCTFPSNQIWNVNNSLTGAIQIGTSNIVIDCNGTKIYGNSSVNSEGVYSAGKSNITVQNCIFSNFYRGINIVGSNSFNVSILNTIVYNNPKAGIYLGGVTNSLIDNVTSYNASLEHGLYLDVLFNGFGNNSIVRNSRFYNNTGSGIQINTASVDNYRNVSIYGNELFNNAGSGINDLGMTLSFVYGNLIHDNDIAGIAISYNGEGTTDAGINFTSKFNQFFNNNIYANVYDIVVANVTHGNFLYNNTYGNKDIIYRGFGNFSMNESTYPLNITVFRTNQAVINFNYIGSKYFNWSNNILTLNPQSFNLSICNKTSSGCSNVWNNIPSMNITVGANENFEVSKASESGGCDYPQENQQVINPYTICLSVKYNKTGISDLFNMSYFGFYNLTYRYTATQQLKIYSRVNSTLTIFGNSYKSVTVVNDTFSLFNLTDSLPFVSIFKSNQTSPLLENVKEANVTMEPNEVTCVQNYLTDTQPKFSSMNVSAACPAINYTSGRLELTIYSDTTITQLTPLIGSNHLYRIYKDGSFITSSNADSYLFTSGSWVIYSSSPVVELRDMMAPKIKSSILGIADWFPIFIIIIIGGVIYLGFVAFKNRDNFDIGNLDLSNIEKLLIGLFVCMLLLVITLVMISSMGG